MESKLICGNNHSDDRGTIIYNNDFDLSQIKRIYFIENKNTDFVRAWQGHKIERRWFTATQGSFLIRIIAVDDWKIPNSNLTKENYTLKTANFEVLQIPKGYVSSIQALEKNSKLMVMADYLIGEIQDEFRFPVDYFDEKK